VLSGSSALPRAGSSGPPGPTAGLRLMESLWKTSKETSPLVDGLSEHERSTKKKATKDLGELFRKDGKHKDRRETEMDRESDLFRRLVQLLDDHTRREMCRVEDMISAAVGRVGEAFGAQVEALRRDFARVQSRGLEDVDNLSHAGSSPRNARLNSHRSGASTASRGTSPEAYAGLPALRSNLEEQRIRTEAQFSTLLNRVNALQQSLTELVMEQELHHIATGKFACTVTTFSNKEREASLSALTTREAAARERLRKIKRPSKTATTIPSGLRNATIGGVDDRFSEGSSASSKASAVATSPTQTHHHAATNRRPSIQEEEDDETPTVKLLPTKGSASASTNEQTG